MSDADMTIAEFCSAHNACADGRKWALANCRDMQHAWQTLKPEWLLWVAARSGVLGDKELRLFAVWCARQVQHLMSDQRSIDALDVAERFAHGNATREELDSARGAAAAAMDAAMDAVTAAARTAAWVAATDAARNAMTTAARTAARTAAWAAATDAAWTAARNATRAAARDAVTAAAMDAAMDAVTAAARDAQAEWLRKNTSPNFRRAP